MANDFGLQLQQFADKTGETLEDVDVAFKLGLFNRIVRNTRVDTGRMKGNWQVSNGAPAQGETGRLATAGAATVDASEAARIAPFSATYLTNNVPYAVIWEERDGMVGLGIAEARAALEKAVAEND